MNRNCSPLCTVPKPCLCKQCHFVAILRLNPRLNKQVGDCQKLILWTKICFLKYCAGYSTALPLQQAPCKQCRFATIFLFQIFCQNSEFFLFCYLDNPFGWILDQTNKQTNILLKIWSHLWTKQKFLNHRARLQHSPASAAGSLQAMPLCHHLPFSNFLSKFRIFSVLLSRQPFWLNPGSNKQTNKHSPENLISFMNKTKISEPPCTVTAQPCLCSRLLASNAALPPSWATDIAQQSYQIALAAF